VADNADLAALREARAKDKDTDPANLMALLHALILEKLSVVCEIAVERGVPLSAGHPAMRDAIDWLTEVRPDDTRDTLARRIQEGLAHGLERLAEERASRNRIGAR
jgi:hypothetical protein